jgi:magnesium-transporting ATPase (P-type)
MFWHMLMVGWITQIIMGVSLWMFPGRIKEESFKNQKWAWLTYVFLNGGLIVRFLSEPMIVLLEGYHWKILLIISAILQLVAVLCYITEIWPRVLSKAQRRKKKISSH